MHCLKTDWIIIPMCIVITMTMGKDILVPIMRKDTLVQVMERDTLVPGTENKCNAAVSAMLENRLNYNADVHCNYHDHGAGHACFDHGDGFS